MREYFVISHLHPRSCVPQRSPPPLYSPLQLDFCLSSSLSALLQTSSTPPSWNQVQKTPQGTLIVAALGHAKIDVTLRLKVNVNFGMAKRCHTYFFSFFFKTHFISVYQHFAFYFFALCFNSFNSEACLLRNSISLQVGFHFAFYLHFISHS